MDAVGILSLVFLFIILGVGAYSMVLYSRSAGTQNKAMPQIAKAIDQERKILQTAEELLAAQKETNRLLRESLAETRKEGIS